MQIFVFRFYNWLIFAFQYPNIYKRDLFKYKYNQAEFVDDKMQIIDDAFAELALLISAIGLLANYDERGAITAGAVLRESMNYVALYEEALKRMPLPSPPLYTQ